MTVIVVSGSDDVLRAEKRATVMAEQVGSEDAGLVVTEFGGDDFDLSDVVRAAETAPFLTEFRVVVAIGIERLKAKAEIAPLLSHLADPLPTTRLVLEWGGTGKVPKALVDAVKAAGGELIDTNPGRKLEGFVADAIRDVGLTVDGQTKKRLVDWLGDEPGQLPGLLAILVSSHGPGARLSIADVEPFLGEGGGVPPWDLTDAIDRGDIAAALTTLHRMLATGRHPLQLMATLHTHFGRILRLDGAPVRSEKDAADLLGMKGSTFPAKKALTQARKLGSDGVAESISLLGRTDLELRGTVDWPDELAMELLVARLARVARSRR